MSGEKKKMTPKRLFNIANNLKQATKDAGFIFKAATAKEKFDTTVESGKGFLAELKSLLEDVEERGED